MSKSTTEKPFERQTQNAVKSDRKLTPDQQIELRRLEQLSRIKKIVFIASAVIATTLVAFIISQSNSNTSTEKSSSQIFVATTELSSEQLERYREQFKQALASYEVEVQPEINKILLSEWEVTRVNELTLIKEKALNAFAKAAFQQAKQYYDDLVSRSEMLIMEYNTQVRDYVDAGKQAFEQDNISLAQIHVNKALNLMPTNAQAIELQTRINAYSEVSVLLSELKVAKIENNLPKQIDLLNDIVDLDPNRDDLAEDLQKVKFDYDRQRLEDLLTKAEQAINREELDKAQSYLNSAISIKPDSKGVQNLQTRINNKRATQTLQQVLSKLETYSNQDNWQGVETLSKQNIQKYPNNSELFDYSQKATQVLTAIKRLSPFLAGPERLADENIREAAKLEVSKAFAASLLSPSLVEQIELVSNYIDKFEKDVPVTISSDGSTYILVLGLGHVGQQVEKVISLKPGKYTLEGRREGYRSKRMDIEVKANQPLTVSLVCDEPVVN